MSTDPQDDIACTACEAEAAEGQAAAAVAEVRALRETLADAVAAERMAIGAWLRAEAPRARTFQDLAGRVEHGDHIDDDAPPLPSLRLTLAARRMLLEQVTAADDKLKALRERVAALEAERDRRIDPVEHARAVMASYSAWAGDTGAARSVWADSQHRAALWLRVGPDVLAEVEDG
jgi:hypothetical protein